jgi:hypothetical protein
MSDDGDGLETDFFFFFFFFFFPAGPRLTSNLATLDGHSCDDEIFAPSSVVGL